MVPQTLKAALEDLGKILKAAELQHGTMSVSVTVYLADIHDFQAMKQRYVYDGDTARPKTDTYYHSSCGARERWPDRNLHDRGQALEKPKKQPHDSALGMDHEITRRDFMNATLLAFGGEVLLR